MTARKKSSPRTSAGSKKKTAVRRAAARKKAPAKKAARPGRGQRVKRTAAERPIVVYIHGIGRQPSADELKHRWDLALFGSDRGDDTRMAYWADLLRPASETGPKRTRSTSARRRDLDSRALFYLEGSEAHSLPADHEPHLIELARGSGAQVLSRHHPALPGRVHEDGSEGRRLLRVPGRQPADVRIGRGDQGQVTVKLFDFCQPRGLALQPAVKQAAEPGECDGEEDRGRR